MAAFKASVQNRLVTGEVSFFAPLKKLNLKTFSSTLWKKNIRYSNREIVSKADRNLFADFQF